MLRRRHFGLRDFGPRNFRPRQLSHRLSEEAKLSIYAGVLANRNSSVRTLSGTLSQSPCLSCLNNFTLGYHGLVSRSKSQRQSGTLDCGELSRVLTGKTKRSTSQARGAVLGWADSFEVADSTWFAFQAALDLTVDHQLQMWDALILAVAAEHHCRMLISEDFHTGFTWRGVTIVNPFAAEPSPLLTRLLRSSN